MNLPASAAQLLGVVLFRFRRMPRVWAIVLIAVNALSLFFLHTIYGQLALAAVLIGVAVMIPIHAKLGFVRLLGVGHFLWPPMLIWFCLNMPERSADPLLFDWLVTLIVCNSISLVIDTLDVIRFVRGEREPHYCWDS